MGLVDFLKNAAKKLHLTHEDPPPPHPEATPEEIKAGLERVRAAALVKMVNDMGLTVENLEIQIDDDTVFATGTAPSQEVKEKVILLIGNVDGIAHVDDQLEVENPEPPAQYYTVVSGDTLSHIAKHFYGNANKYPQIFEANRPMLKDPDAIFPGQVLRIPAE